MLRWLGYLVGLTAILSILIGLALPSKGFLHSVNGGVVSVDKQLLPGGLLIGFLTDGNSVGQILAVGIPLVAIIRRPSHRWVLLGACFLALVWTASRSSMLAVALAIIAAAVLKITVPPLRRLGGSRHGGSRGPHSWLCSLSLSPIPWRSPTAATSGRSA